MNGQLNHVLDRRRTAQPQHACEQARALGSLIVPVMLAVLALSVPAAMADPLGQVTEFSAGLNPGSSPGTLFPGPIAAGPDGNLWFTDANGAIGRIGTGAPSALQSRGGVSGEGRAGSAESCHVQWPVWAGYSPMAGPYPFDGNAWLRDGSPITGQTTATYTPAAGDVGHHLACRATVTYPLPFSVTATATSAAINVQSAPPPPPTPALSALSISPRMFTLTGRRVGGHCQPVTRADRRHRRCTRPAALTLRFTLSTSATVTVAIERALPGRLTRNGCAARTRSDRRHGRCTRLAVLPGTVPLAGVAGVNSFTLPGAIGGHTLEPGRYRLHRGDNQLIHNPPANNRREQRASPVKSL